MLILTLKLKVNVGGMLLNLMTNYSIENSDLGVKLLLIVNPNQCKNFQWNFFLSCKHGIVTIVEAWLKMAQWNTNDILLLIAPMLTHYFYLPFDIIKLIIDFFKPIFTINDLFFYCNTFGETPLSMAAKYQVLSFVCVCFVCVLFFFAVFRNCECSVVYKVAPSLSFPAIFFNGFF